MAKLPIVKIGEEVLRGKAAAIPPEDCTDGALKKFLKDMVETMHEAQGVGLAANQVGEGKQAIVLECGLSGRYPEGDKVPLQMYLNPKIIHYSEETDEHWEGCLSIPGYRGLVPRSLSVTFEALTPEGERVEKTVHGFQARIIQHEVDHINGLFYMDRMQGLNHWHHLDSFNKKFESDIKDKV